ncbi:BglII/BstYI family type II restriction endonuclease [Hankyongella ginsenosidimutans]|uniref:BglII/BstYI family type II restriction endonuclease n=1 Tax=Hankyongella ginsenosidimutans TaxID=1763828 RepID=UPI001CA320D1|nr:BglII/BstYI family type II restriction endonuclease [Hankyongella ginsenosidimutans]
MEKCYWCIKYGMSQRMDRNSVCPTVFPSLEKRDRRSWGNRSTIVERLEKPLKEAGWQERQFATTIVVDGVSRESPTHKVDCFKGRVALELEWNNKDPFYDRDLNNFRLLFDLQVIDVGIIITRCSELQNVFNALGKGSSYGNSTTHMGKLLPRIRGGSGGGCPIAVFGISHKLYVEDVPISGQE